MDLTFTVAFVLNTLKTQLDDHKQIVGEAWDGYRDQMANKLGEALDLLDDGGRHVITITLRAPQDHTRDIERAIEMLEHTTQDEIELGEHQFSCYVQGRWDWMHDFLRTASVYSGKAGEEFKKL